MGTYTTNYQLYMPTVGETGWGTLVNGNFTTIDTTIKGLNTRLTAVENEVNGALSCTSVTTSGKVTGNGGIVGSTGTFSGLVSGKNIPYGILTPVKIYVSTSPPTQYTYNFTGETIAGYKSVNAGIYYNIGILNNIAISANSSITLKYLPTNDSNTLGVPLPYSGDINVAGSWGYYVSIQASSGNTVKITNSGGLNKTFNSTNGQYQTLTSTELKSILTHVNTITITNTTGQYYGYHQFGISVKNNNSNMGYVYCSNGDYL